MYVDKALHRHAPRALPTGACAAAVADTWARMVMRDADRQPDKPSHYETQSICSRGRLDETRTGHVTTQTPSQHDQQCMKI